MCGTLFLIPMCLLFRLIGNFDIKRVNKCSNQKLHFSEYLLVNFNSSYGLFLSYALPYLHGQFFPAEASPLSAMWSHSLQDLHLQTFAAIQQEMPQVPKHMDRRLG